MFRLLVEVSYKYSMLGIGYTSLSVFQVLQIFPKLLDNAFVAIVVKTGWSHYRTKWIETHSFPSVNDEWFECLIVHFYLELYSFIDILSWPRNGMVFSFRLLWYLHLESIFENCTKKAAQESDSFPSGLRHVTFIYNANLKHKLTQVLSAEDKLTLCKYW